ncbi:MAG: TonB-dependent receptor [Pseudomonadota bacterium]
MAVFTLSGVVDRKPLKVLCFVASFALFNTSGAQGYESAETFDFSIQAQPLEAALEEFGRVTRRQVAADANVIRRQTSGPVTGRMTPQQALTRLIADTGLRVVAISDLDFALRTLDASETEPTGGAIAQNVEEIVVYGTKRNLTLQDTQTSVALYDQAQIEKQALFSLADIIIRTANVSAAGLGSRALNQMSIRGIELGGIGGAGTGGTASVYIDGAPASFNANQGAMNIWDVGQVEILRGPQSTIQGRNALAGAVVLNTLDPEYDFGARFQLLAGEQDTRQYSAMVTGPIIDDVLAYRIAVDRRESDYGVVNPISMINALFQDADTIRAKLLYEPQAVDGLRMEFNVQYIDTEFGEFNTVNAPVPVTDPAFADFDPFGGETFSAGNRLESNKVSRFIIDTQYELNERWSFSSIATFEDVDRDTTFVNAGSSISRDETWSGEFRAHFDLGDWTGWLGAYYFRGEVPNDLTFIFPLGLLGIDADPPDSTVSLITASEEITENYALFADVTYNLNEQWELNFGARYDREDFSTVRMGETVADPPNCVVPAFGGLPCALLLPSGDDPPTEATFDAFLPRAGVTYKFSEDQSLSLGIQRGYRAGGAFIRNNALAGTIETGEFDPEFITNYELSYRSRWLNDRLIINANAFFSDWTDQQVSIPGPSGAVLDVIVVNAGESEISGLEISATGRWTDGFDTFLTLGFLDTEFKDFPFAFDTGTTFDNLAGREFTSAPKFSASGGFNYEHESGFYTNWTISYNGSQYSDVTNLPVDQVGGYAIVNSRIGW